MTTLQTTGEFNWILPLADNFPKWLRGQQQILEETAEFEIGQPSSIRSKWLAKFINPPNQSQVTLKLLEQNTSSHLTVTGGITYSKNCRFGGDPHWKISPLTTLVKGQEIVLDLGLFNLGETLTWFPTLIQNRNLYLKIELTIQGSSPLIDKTCKHSIKIFKESSMSKLQQSFANLLANKSFADLKIVCSDGKELFANRAVLSARNSVFESMLTAEMSESQLGVVNVDDICAKTMQILLNFFYTGELLPEWVEPEVIHQFVYAAGKYHILEILDMLDDVLGSEDVPECNMKLLSLVNKLNLKKAEARLLVNFKKIVENLDSVDELLGIYGNICVNCRSTEETASKKKVKCIGPAE